MTPGTSPRPLGTPSMRWTAAAEGISAGMARLSDGLRQWPLQGWDLRRAASALYLAGLGIVLTPAWHTPAVAGDTIAGFPAWHLAFLMATGATAALLTLAGRDGAEGAGQPSEPGAAATAGLSELVAQMSHELRTPLNAVIGFSEVMLRELHGPLGNARYHEYAHHISESGGRLLKSSEEALAVTEAMTALMADRRAGKRERLAAGTLLRDAWRDATPPSMANKPRLALTTCATCDILCERRPTVQALEHLMREAQTHLGGANSIEVTGKRHGGRRSLEIRAKLELTGGSRSPAAPTRDDEKERAAASPPPLWGRDRVGGIAEHRSWGVPPTPSPSPRGGGESAHRLPLAPSAQTHVPSRIDEFRFRPLASTDSEFHDANRRGSDPLSRNGSARLPDPNARLRIILARLLLEVQGATLTCAIGGDGCWSALIEFPGRG